MRHTYREVVTESLAARGYQGWLSGELARHEGALLDLSGALWLDDALFMDQLHLGAAGAARVSTAIGRRVAETLSRPPAP